LSDHLLSLAVAVALGRTTSSDGELMSPTQSVFPQLLRRHAVPRGCRCPLAAPWARSVGSFPAVSSFYCRTCLCAWFRGNGHMGRAWESVYCWKN